MAKGDVSIRIVGDAKQLKKELGDAEKELGKFGTNVQSGLSKKFGPSGFLSDLTSGFGGLPTIIAGAGAALAGFAAGGVADFQRMAQEAGQIAASTQMSVENASAWLSTLRRMGVDASAGDVADVVLNVSQKGADLKKLGIYAQDSSTRLQQLIDYMGSVGDETERATLMAKFFGEEGARQFGVLVASGGEYRQVMRDLNDSEIVSEDELRKSQELNAAWKEFSAELGDLKQRLGEDIIPLLTEAARAGTNFMNGGGLTTASGGSGFWDDAWNSLRDGGRLFTGGWIKEIEDAEAAAKESSKRTTQMYWEQRRKDIQTAGDAYAAMSDAAVKNAYIEERAVTRAQEAIRGEMIVTQGVVNRLSTEHRGFLDALAKSRWVEAYKAQMAAAEGSARKLILTEKELQRAIEDRMTAALGGLDAELNLADARARVADASAMGWNAWSAWQSGEGTQAQFDSAFRDEQRAILAAASAAGSLAQSWGADAAGVIQAQITELQRLQRETPAQTDFINRTIDLLVQAMNGATYSTFPLGVGSKYQSGMTVNVTGGADPYLSLQAASDYSTRNGTPYPV